MKEKIDRQLSGQSATTPFMKVSDVYKSSVGKTSKKAVSFNALETIERTNDSIDTLASLVGKMKVQMDKYDAQYKPQVYQSKRKGQNRLNNNQNDYRSRNRSFSRDRSTSFRGRGNFGRNYRTNYRGKSWDNFKNDYRQDNYRRDYRWDNYRKNSRQDYRKIDIEI